ncbi:hypothetical protein GCM10011492_41790 [Flexivirga endophytica]|uniref:Uncharacterized protein n=1 Tax=Flexivirga endophytica TaxID=1849103 RepID=A0A916THW1_9MICO|nr:hypothetical protein [Flexivirga endophytica]GGB46226.1 hypothetical protein GCM10011492_41790 [Flexivirga endophytica]GHB70008.1 hypothetical protein GCM10008112_43130 [Flexivirga endophytica]
MTETPNEGERHPDGWAAWGKQDGEPLKPTPQQPLESVESDSEDTGEQAPDKKS